MTQKYDVLPVDVVKTLSGLELLQGISEGRLPAPPIFEVLGVIPGEVKPGQVLFQMTPGKHLYNPMGTVHGGIAAMLLDTAMGCAVHSTLPAGRGYTTLEFKVNLVRAITEHTGSMTVEGRILHPGRKAATSEGFLRDSQGKLLAHGTTTCLVFDL
jgi:uncharacterized protein (TIGR00369 family)